MEKSQEVHSYFSRNAASWNASAESSEYSGIRDRHRVVHLVVSDRSQTRSALDLGCGSGQLCVELSQRSISVVGLDISAEMIELAERNAKAAGSVASFRVGDVTEDLTRLGTFDLISAQGLIEYLQLESIDSFFSAVASALRPGGSFVCGSRNRLFNVVSLNEYTTMERQLGCLDRLCGEAMTLARSDSTSSALPELRRMQGTWLYPSSTPNTGINVTERLQFSPSDLVIRLEKAGLRVSNIYPVHLQPIVPSQGIASRLLAAGRELAEMATMDEFRSHRLLPWSSSFSVHALRSM